MGVDPVTLALVIGGASAAASTAGAIGQNQAVRRSEKEAVRSAQAQRNQLSQQKSLEAQRRAIELDKTRGRLRVLAADAGQSIDGSFGLLMDQAALDAEAGRRISDINFINRGVQIQSQLGATFAQLSASRQSPLFAGIQGGLAGFSTGLSIGNALATAPVAAAPTTTGVLAGPDTAVRVMQGSTFP